MKTKDLFELRTDAEEGLAEAQRELACRLLDGRDVLRDEVEARRWFLLASRQNDAEAQYRLGLCYEKGIGTRRNERRARKWLRRAAEQGHSEAARLLRSRYRLIGSWVGVLISFFVGTLGLYLGDSCLTGLVSFLVCRILFQVLLDA